MAFCIWLLCWNRCFMIKKIGTNLLFIRLIFRVRFSLRFFPLFLWSAWSIFWWIWPTFGSTFWCFCLLTRVCLKANIFHYIVKPLTKMFCLNRPFRESLENFIMLAWCFQIQCHENPYWNAMRCGESKLHFTYPNETIWTCIHSKLIEETAIHKQASEARSPTSFR